ncbi:MAG: HPr family phosphocarrier protein [Pseudomonadota bacterium]
MQSSKIEIINKLGLHARAAAKLVKLCGEFASEINIGQPDKMVNAKSIMGIMMLAASKGTVLAIEVSGDDETEAHTAVRELFENRFDEDE